MLDSRSCTFVRMRAPEREKRTEFLQGGFFCGGFKFLFGKLNFQQYLIRDCVLSPLALAGLSVRLSDGRVGEAGWNYKII